MLSNLRFTNFKAWSAVDLNCARITGLFGTNSSGKTSLIHFLLLLKQTKDGTDRAISLALNGDIVQLGTIIDVIYRHNEQSTIEWSLSFTPEQVFKVKDVLSSPSAAPIVSSDTVIVGSDIAVQGDAPVAVSLTYQLGELTFSLSRKRTDSKSYELFPSKSQPGVGGFAFIRTTGRVWALPGPVKGYAFPDQARTYFQHSGVLSDVQAVYEHQLDNVFYLGPLREEPRRDYLWARSRPSDVGYRGQKAIEAILAATDANERRNLAPRSRLIPFQEMVAYWLKHMGLIQDFRVEEIAKGSNRWQAKVVTRAGTAEVLLPDVGFGVSQVLPVITLLLYVPSGSTVVLEQPEIHLHPLAQAGLADILIYAARHRKIQVIMESHSEHLLLRIQRRVAEKTLSSDDVALYFCDAPDGKSQLNPLKLDLFGQIENWPEHFMGDAFGETLEAERARLIRMAS